MSSRRDTSSRSTNSVRRATGAQPAAAAGRRRPLGATLAAALTLTLCVPQLHAVDKVHWVSSSFSGSAVRTAHLNGDNPGSIWPGVTGTELALDPTTNMLFWSDNSVLPGRLMTAAKAGAGAATVCATTVPGERIHDIAIDPAGTGTAYWTDRNQLHIYRATLPNGAPTLIPSTAGTMRDIALDLRPGKQHLYVYNGSSLHRSDLPDGANEVVLQGFIGDGSPGQIALDTCNDRVFVIGHTTPHPGTPVPFIRRGDLSYGATPGITGITTILSGDADVGLLSSIWLHTSLALDLHAHTLYWSSMTPNVSHQIKRASWKGANVQTLSSSAASYSGIVLDIADDSCTESTIWDDYGGATDGSIGWPELQGEGTLAVGSFNSLDLDDANPSSLAALFLSLSSTPVPFKGGMLKAFPSLDPVLLPTDASGSISLPFGLPAALPAGLELWVQLVILDPGSPYGMSLSNAVMGSAP